MAIYEKSLRRSVQPVHLIMFSKLRTVKATDRVMSPLSSIEVGRELVNEELYESHIS